MIDWTNLDQYPEYTVECKCGHIYRSHAKFDITILQIVARIPCANCGDTHMRAARSDPESHTLG
jgi:hypothetical protein